MLVNSVLSACAVYPMCSLLIPAGIVEGIDKKRRALLWTGYPSCNGGQCKVAWETVCLDKPEGGLGVKNLSQQNKGLLAKFLFKLFQEPTTGWQLWFHRMYGAGAGRDLGDPHYLDTPTWTFLLKVLPSFKECTYNLLGDGKHTSFWFDKWLGERPLAEALASLHSFCSRPNISVVAACPGGTWSFPLHSRLSTQASLENQQLMIALARAVPMGGISDHRGVSNLI